LKVIARLAPQFTTPNIANFETPNEPPVVPTGGRLKGRVQHGGPSLKFRGYYNFTIRDLPFDSST